MSEHSSAVSPEARLESVQRDLARIRSQTNRSSLLTTVIGLAALCLLGFYFWFGYNAFAEATKPETIVGAAATMIDENMPKARQSIEEQVKESAPAWAEGLSKQAVAAMPTAREELQKYLLTEMDKAIQQSHLLTEAKYREILKNHRPQILKVVHELTTSPQMAAESVAELEKTMEAELQADMKRDSRELLEALILINERLQKMAKNQPLNEEEQLEQRVAQLARRIQLEQGPTPTAVAADTTAPGPKLETVSEPIVSGKPRATKLTPAGSPDPGLKGKPASKSEPASAPKPGATNPDPAAKVEKPKAN
jgi:hypothetical protein